MYPCTCRTASKLTDNPTNQWQPRPEPRAAASVGVGLPPSSSGPPPDSWSPASGGIEPGTSVWFQPRWAVWFMYRCCKEAAAPSVKYKRQKSLLSLTLLWYSYERQWNSKVRLLMSFFSYHRLFISVFFSLGTQTLASKQHKHFRILNTLTTAASCLLLAKVFGSASGSYGLGLIE